MLVMWAELQRFPLGGQRSRETKVGNLCEIPTPGVINGCMRTSPAPVTNQGNDNMRGDSIKTVTETVIFIRTGEGETSD